jgi:predicted RNA-binding protein YlxR (DUF448 family)
VTRRARPHHALLRTCVGCRQRAPVSELLRVVAIGLSLKPDPRRVLPGRGAHLHPEPGCLESALRRRAFGRALRITGVPDAGELVEAINAKVAKTVGGAAALLKE